MSSDQFHSFLKLPGELRWQIWKDAICSNPMPRIHYCSLRKDSRELNQSLLQSTIVCPAEVIPYTYDRPSWHQHAIIEANKPVHQVNDEWVEATRYRSYWDFGLRTACRESRRAVLLSYRPFVADGWVPRLAKIGEEVVQMLMDPDADIICLELSPEELKETVKLDWSTLIFRPNLSTSALSTDQHCL
ncbi:hypothetical protein F5X68DRAFT_234030 [Plectosphaerella plurivora]|uniref:2EXR domain-containing protein n=1 Tax=Plectosphaerella plurivora TaxID=936078 RepID=A0A9P9A8W1_9PEZI|nr:hypothetical protein F5X68DRAFT_234030 [Plectosphaerella plurivora]